MFQPSPGALVAHRFRLRHPIGKGGMGQVWEAHDKELDGPCAVKFIVDHLARDPEARLRIVREARAVARLRSPHVVNILSVGEHEDAMYLAMELLEGETLSSRLERNGKLDAGTTLALLEQVEQVLDKAHAHGVVHRDLKPDNIWLCAEPKLFVKVLDFGIAKSQRLGAGATASGALMGTPQYMSPEQANGEREVDHRSDLWALAIIAMECLSGKRPYEASGLGNLLMKIMSSPPPAVHDLDPTLPASLAPWWQRALAHDPNARFQNAADLVQGLRAGLAALPPGRGPSLFDHTARGNWAEPTPAPQPQPARVRTLVTNIHPTPLSEPTPALRLEHAQRPADAAAGPHAADVGAARARHLGRARHAHRGADAPLPTAQAALGGVRAGRHCAGCGGLGYLARAAAFPLQHVRQRRHRHPLEHAAPDRAERGSGGLAAPGGAARQPRGAAERSFAHATGRRAALAAGCDRAGSCHFASDSAALVAARREPVRERAQAQRAGCQGSSAPC